MTYGQELYSTSEIIKKALNEPEEETLISAKKLVFCGCGTSYYMAGACAKLCKNQNRSASAVDAIELISGAVIPDPESTYVFISRSGESEETVQAMRICKKSGAHTFYLGCTKDSRIEKECDKARVLPYGNETIVLESFSFYVQLTAALACCGLVIDKNLSNLISEAFSKADELYKNVFTKIPFSRIISLASPFYRNLNREMMLKDGEITRLSVEDWGVLEFRHGPRCWCNETTLIHIMSENATAGIDAAVAKELVSYGCPVIWYGENAPKGSYEVSFDTPHLGVAETLAYAAFHTALAVKLGEERNIDMTNLPHVVHHVGGI